MPSLTPEQTDVLLDKLSNDKAFRELFQQDPAAAMKQLPGPPVEVPSGPPGSSCLRPKELMSPEQIAAIREKLVLQFTGLTSFIPHCIDAAP
jgi:putative modified peptide